MIKRSTVFVKRYVEILAVFISFPKSNVFIYIKKLNPEQNS